MQALDHEVLQRATEWLAQGRGVHLFTVVQTWGSAPRLPGAVLAIRDDGHLVGSVSGGCIEDDLADKARHGQLPETASLIEYGVSRDEAQRFGIPCGGRLLIFAEPLRDSVALIQIMHGMQQRKLIKRS
ncbi:MAG TPA: XdhC family protein, partial [Methylophilaceae bacterium]|nr:XdhC family protein [Methylophilaceae bacterium]